MSRTGRPNGGNIERRNGKPYAIRVTLHRASARLQDWPTSTLWLACLACLPSGDTLTCAELDEALQDGRLHDIQGADAVEAIEKILAQQSATIPAPAPTVETPAPIEASPEEHLRLALEHLEKAIKGFEPGPATYRLEFAAQDLSAVLDSVNLARSLETEKAAEAA